MASSKTVHHPLPFSAAVSSTTTPAETHPTPKPRPLSTSSALTTSTSPRARQQALSIDGRTAFPPTTFFPGSPPSQSTTHAGGIQPSASFFHPSRPSHHTQFSRPSSSDSSSAPSNTIPPILAPEGDVFQLAPLTKVQSNATSEEGGLATTEEGGRASTVDDHHTRRTQNLPAPGNRASHSTSVKQSREPLLPIGARGPGKSTSIRTPVQRGHASALSGGGGARKLRNSLEKVISRALSLESRRRSTLVSRPRHSTTDDSSLPPPPPSEGKIVDEEQGMFHGVVSPSVLSPAQPTFIPHPPAPTTTTPTHAPLSAVPVLDASGKPVRRYQRHPSRNRFFFSGRLLTGGDSPWAFIGSMFLVLAISGTWFSTTCVWWWKNISPAVVAGGAYLFLVVISSMLTTAMCDPGILPRDLDPHPPYPATSSLDGDIPVPLPRDLKVRRDIVRVKYCPTCRTYRPPRSSHCKMCDNCVDGCDHHCQWINNCVGRRNYITFFVFLTSATLNLIFVVVTAALHIYFIMQRDHVGFRKGIMKAIGSAVVFCLAVAVIWPVAALLTYHLRLLLLNVTTIEQIRNQAHKSFMPGPVPPNPFSHGTWKRNLTAVLCRPVGFSWLDGHGVVTEDKREVNPGVRWDDDDGK